MVARERPRPRELAEQRRQSRRLNSEFLAGQRIDYRQEPQVTKRTEFRFPDDSAG